MKSVKDMIAINRFETMRERHRRWWDLNRGSLSMTKEEFVTRIMDRVKATHADRFAAGDAPIDSTKAH